MTTKPNSTNLLNYVEYSQRAEAAQRLMQTDLVESRKRFVTVAYLQSLMAADYINSSARLDFKDSRGKVIDAATQFLNDPNPEIAAAANFALVLVHIDDFWEERDPRHLDLLRTQFDKSYKQIFNDFNATGQFVSLIYRLNSDAENQAEVTSLLMHVLSQFETQITPDNKELLTAFRDLLFFGDLELNTLLKDVEDNDPNASKRVRRFFDILARNPQAGITIYKLAVQVIAAYKALGQDQLADLFEKRLRAIALKITDADERDKVLAGIENPQSISDEIESEGLNLGIDLEALGSEAAMPRQ